MTWARPSSRRLPAYMHLSPAALDSAIRLLETGTETVVAKPNLLLTAAVPTALNNRRSRYPPEERCCQEYGGFPERGGRLDVDRRIRVLVSLFCLAGSLEGLVSRAASPEAMVRLCPRHATLERGARGWVARSAFSAYPFLAGTWSSSQSQLDNEFETDRIRIRRNHRNASSFPCGLHAIGNSPQRPVKKKGEDSASPSFYFQNVNLAPT